MTRTVAIVGSLLLAAGCMPTRVRLPHSLPAGEPIAIITPMEDPPLVFTRPVAGTMSGILAGFGRGIGYTLALALSGQGYGIILTAPLAAVFGVVYIPLSTIVGGTTAEARARLDAADACILRAMADADLHRSLGDEVQRCARERMGRDWPVARVDLASPDVPDGTGCLLELRILPVTNGATLNLLTLNRPFEVQVTTRARMIRVSDGVVLGTIHVGYAHPDRAHTYAEWAADGGRLLREELGEACRAMAAEILERLDWTQAGVREKKP